MPQNYEFYDYLYNLALPCIYYPTFSKLSKSNSTLTNALRAAFVQVENQYPGFGEQFIIRLLQRLGVNDDINLPETYLRIAGLHTQLCESMENKGINRIEIFANVLKLCLSKIPDEISSNNGFTNLIREITEITDKFLESLHCHDKQILQRRALCNLKFEFIRSCKRFSETLKAYNRDENQTSVIFRANQLVVCTNTILDALRCDK
ncbi:hypothetical protein Smp_006680 [Schistosoma mansoni]|uniref:Programmed cell death protein n=2 Tax=Schistosoma mansoni TaxID=6183 RepID=G4V9W0_SCHMA|nr:hypothetical protein Smp_006680 [Schistosoma mansoni]|eukprot:XP_018648239.1 hypothetical protein Smp_006680 [Schistosoma mansoni]